MEPLFKHALMLGLANAQSVFVDDYPPSQGVVAASGSIFHLLTIPTFRVYNAISLPVANSDGEPPLTSKSLVTEMRDETRRFVFSNIDLVIARSELEAEAKLNKLYGKTESAEQLQLRKTNCLQRIRKTWSDFQHSGEQLELGFFFHIHDDHTIGHMHMHCFPLNDCLRTNLAHDFKCMPFDELIAVL